MKTPKKLQIEQILKELAKNAKPDREFAKMLQFKLKDKFTELYSGLEENPKQGISFFGHMLRLKLRFITATILVLFTSSTIYAYGSDSVTNGHILYPLKRSTEKVEGIFAKSAEAKSTYFNRMAERRIRELDYLEKQGRFDEETVVKANEFISRAEVEINHISVENKIETEIFSSRQIRQENTSIQPAESETSLTEEFTNRNKIQQKLKLNRNILEKKIELHREKLPTELKDRSIPSIITPIKTPIPEVDTRLEIKDNQPIKIFDPEIFTSELTEIPPSNKIYSTLLEKQPKTPLIPEIDSPPMEVSKIDIKRNISDERPEKTKETPKTDLSPEKIKPKDLTRF